MTKRKIVLASVVCLSIAAFAGQSFYGRQRPPAAVPDWVFKAQRLDPNERQEYVRKVLKNQGEQRRRQLQAQREKESARARDEAMRQLLGASERQWAIIKPKMENVRAIRAQQWRSAIGLSYFMDDPNSNSDNAASQSKYKYSWKWSRPSEHKKSDKAGSISNKTFSILESKESAELTESEKICEELLGLLEDEHSNKPEEHIRQKVEALRKIRRKGKEELTKAQQELREVLTTVRQEAALVWKGLLP